MYLQNENSTQWLLNVSNPVKKRKNKVVLILPNQTYICKQKYCLYVNY